MCFFFVLSAVLLEKVENIKSTTSLMIWSQKWAQQTAQLTTRKSTKKNATFRLKKHNFPAQKFTTAAPPNPQVALNLQSTRACQPSLSLDPAWGPCHPLVWPALAYVSVGSGTRYIVWSSLAPVSVKPLVSLNTRQPSQWNDSCDSYGSI